MDSKRVLILGGTGMLGHKLWLTFRKKFDTFVTLRGPYEKYKSLDLFDPNRTLENADAEDKDRFLEIFKMIEPNVVINCIGIIKQVPQAKEERTTIKINALFPHELAAWADHFGAKVIHMSTDCVFSGKKGNYSEEDISDATDFYGRTKFLGEIRQAPHLTIRSSIIGRDFCHHLGLLEWFLRRTPKEKVRGFTKAIYTGFTTGAMANIMATIIGEKRSLSGLYHIASQPIDKYSLLKKLQKAFNLDIELLPFDDFHCDLSLDGRRFNRETGFRLSSWDEMVKGLVEENAFYQRIQNAF